MISVRSPGRINLIGEHTDYHGGFALPAAIDKQVELSIHKNGSPYLCRALAGNFNEQVEFDLRERLEPASKWQNYVFGVVKELEKRGAVVEGFDVEFSGNVPLGSGMSSSAALECGFAFALNELFDLGLSKMVMIEASQMAEHNYVGTKCGIMDQFASMMGKEEKAILLDCKTLEYSYLPIQLGKYQIVIINSNVSHSHAESGYNTRRAESEEGLSILKKKYPKVELLRDVNLEMLKSVEHQMTAIVYRRCEYVIRENRRVLDAAEALKKSDFHGFGQLMYGSHEGLQYGYEASCPEMDFLVDQTRPHPEILGARMMGGGFGGCTINLVQRDFVAPFIEKLSSNYREKFDLELTPYSVSIENGTSLF